MNFSHYIAEQIASQMDGPSFNEIYDGWESMLAEERYVHQDFQCDACHKVSIHHAADL